MYPDCILEPGKGGIIPHCLSHFPLLEKQFGTFSIKICPISRDTGAYIQTFTGKRNDSIMDLWVKVQIMNRIVFSGVIMIFMMISLVSISNAVESPLYVIHIQGGESRITNISDGLIEMTVSDIAVNATITDGNTSHSMPIEGLINLSVPADAAVVYPGTGNKSISMIQISQISLSSDGKNLTLQVSPLRFYDGEGLKSYAENQTELFSSPYRNLTTTELFIETRVNIAENRAKTCPNGEYWCDVSGTCLGMYESWDCGGVMQ